MDDAGESDETASDKSSFTGLIALLSLFFSRIRQWLVILAQGWSTYFTRFPMGLGRGRRNPKAHGIIALDEFSNLELWIKSLSRSCRTTLLKQVDKSFTANNLQVTSRRAGKLNRGHLYLIYEHQERSGSKFPIIGALLRFWVASMMIGTLDEYRIGDTLVAFSHSIVKGDTLRAMWFYQSNASEKMYIWFYSLRLSVQRALKLDGVRFVDVGPSVSARVSDLKRKYGCIITTEWESMCDYSGPFTDCALKDKLHKE